jgi:hypothetical protein
MSAGFILALCIVSALFWSGIAAAFVGARYPRHRVQALSVAIGCWAVSLVALMAWGV